LKGYMRALRLGLGPEALRIGLIVARLVSASLRLAQASNC
jgi:hypothetical protein